MTVLSTQEPYNLGTYSFSNLKCHRMISDPHFVLGPLFQFVNVHSVVLLSVCTPSLLLFFSVLGDFFSLNQLHLLHFFLSGPKTFLAVQVKPKTKKTVKR